MWSEGNLTKLQRFSCRISCRTIKEAGMKARSQAQQKAAGAALAAKRGKVSRRKLTGASKQMVETMTESEHRS
jgi:hypothetical protein